MANETASLNEAKKYYSGEGRKSPNYPLAKKHFEEVLEVNPNHKVALYYLGFMARKGQGGPVDLELAKNYFAKGTALDHDPAKRELFALLQKEAQSAVDWFSLGENYYYVESNYKVALECYLKAVAQDPDHAASLFSLGFLYKNHKAVKNIVQAKTYFGLTLEAGHKLAAEQLIEIYEKELTTAEQWYDLGENFYWGKNHTVQSYEMAMDCYKRAIKKDQQHAQAHYSIGWLYEHGEGVNSNSEEAQRCYLVASNLDSLSAKTSLLLLANPELTSAQQWHELGNNYFYGLEDYDHDFILARICYEQALELDKAYQGSLLKLGTIYEECKGVTVDFAKAREFYEKLTSRDKKLHLKRVEKKRVQALLAEGKSIDVKDKNNHTALQRAARDKNLKLYATLKILGAQEDVLDMNQKPSSFYLTRNEKIAVERHQNLFNSYLQSMDWSAPKIVASRIVIQGAPYEDVITDQVVTELYQNPDLKPLFELAKLAMLGKHKLSGRPVVVNEGYDSDNEVAADPEQCLTIKIDSKNRSINGLVCREKPKRGTVGIFIPDMPNSLFIGGDRDKQEVRSTIVHELTHFITREIFGDSNPYDNDNITNKVWFTRICNTLKKNFEAKRKRNAKVSANLFEITFDVDDQGYDNYKEEKYHSELIARIAQAIARSDNDLINQGQPERDLLKYYREVFLVKVKNHTQQLTSKAYGGWSPTLFSQNRGQPYHLENTNDIEDSFEGSPPRLG